MKDSLTSTTLSPDLKEYLNIENWDDMLTRINDAVDKINKIDTEKEITLDLNSESFMEDWNEAIKQIESEPITLNIELDEEGKKLLNLFGESLESTVTVTGGIETTSKELVNNISEGVSKGIGNQTIAAQTEVVPTPVPTPTIPAGTTVTQKHQVDINMKFEGQPPKGVDKESLKEIIRTEIGKAIRSVF